MTWFLCETIRKSGVKGCRVYAGLRETSISILSTIIWAAEQKCHPALSRSFQLPKSPRNPAAAPALWAADQGVASALSDNTRRVYGAQWRLFNDWCGDVGLPSLPAEPLTVARYLAARAGDGASIATLRLATSAIGKAHEWAKQESPCRDPGVRASMKGSGGKTPVEASATVAEPR